MPASSSGLFNSRKILSQGAGEIVEEKILHPSIEKSVCFTAAFIDVVPAASCFLELGCSLSCFFRTYIRAGQHCFQENKFGSNILAIRVAGRSPFRKRDCVTAGRGFVVLWTYLDDVIAYAT
jgi:hypothetical protein